MCFVCFSLNQLYQYQNLKSTERLSKLLITSSQFRQRGSLRLAVFILAYLIITYVGIGGSSRMLAFRVPSMLKAHDLGFEMLACTEVIGCFPHNLYFCVCSTCILWHKSMLKLSVRTENKWGTRSMNDIRKYPDFQIFNYNHLTVLLGAAALFSMLLPPNALHSWTVISVLITQVGVWI